MLKITIDMGDGFDEATNRFVDGATVTLELEHSLVSLSKWESKFEKPFLGRESKTSAETLAYIEAMILTPNFSPEVFSKLSSENIAEINEYIGAKMTATTINSRDQRPSRQVITSELIYYWMVAMNIPFECQYWHLNRLLMLVRVCNEMNKPQKKMSKRDLMDRNRSLNAQRRAASGSSG